MADSLNIPVVISGTDDLSPALAKMQAALAGLTASAAEASAVLQGLAAGGAEAGAAATAASVATEQLAAADAAAATSAQAAAAAMAEAAAAAAEEAAAAGEASAALGALNEEFVGGIKSMAAAFVGFEAIKAVIGETVAAARDMEQAQRRLGALFGSSAEEFAAYSEQLAAGTNFTATQFEKAASALEPLRRDYGLTDEQIKQLMVTSADLAALYGVDLVQASNDVAQSIRGVGRAGVEVGLNLRPNVIQAMTDLSAAQKAAAQGGDNTAAAMARYAVVVSEAGKASGEAGRQAGEAGNNFAKLDKATADLFETLGKSGSIGGVVGDLATAATAAGDLLKIVDNLSARVKGGDLGDGLEKVGSALQSMDAQVKGAIPGLEALGLLMGGFGQDAVALQAAIDALTHGSFLGLRSASGEARTALQEAAAAHDRDASAAKADAAATSDAADAVKAMNAALAEQGMALANGQGVGQVIFNEQQAAATKARADAIAASNDALDQQAKGAEAYKAKLTDINGQMRDATLAGIKDEETAYDRAAAKQVQDAQDARDGSIAAAQATRDATVAAIGTAEQAARDAADTDIARYATDAQAEIARAEATRVARLAILADESQKRDDARVTFDRALADSRTKNDRADQAAHDDNLARIHDAQTTYTDALAAEGAANDRATKAATDAEQRRHDAAIADYKQEEAAALAPLQAQLDALDKLRSARQDAATDTSNRRAVGQAEQGLATARRSGDPAQVAQAEQALADAEQRVRDTAAQRQDAAERAAIQQSMERVKAAAAAKVAVEADTTKANGEAIKKTAQDEKDSLDQRTKNGAAYYQARTDQENNAYALFQQHLSDGRTAYDRALADNRKAEDRQFQLTAQGYRDTAQKTIDDANAAAKGQTEAQRATLKTDIEAFTAQRLDAEGTYKAETTAANDTFKTVSTNIATAKQQAHDAFGDRTKDANAAYAAEQANILATYGTGDPSGTGILDKIEKAKQDNAKALTQQIGDWQAWQKAVSASIDIVAGKAAGVHVPSLGDPGGAIPGGGTGGGPLTEAEFGNDALKRSFEANGLSADDVAAACGPILLAGILKATGQAADPAKLTAEAKKAGLWDASSGMLGGGIQALAAAHGISLGQTDFAGVQGALQGGNLAAIDVMPAGNFPGHYLLGQGIDASGRIDFGNTGTALKGGSRYMTLADVTKLTGSSSFRYFTASTAGGAGVKQPSGQTGAIADYIRGSAAALGFVNPDRAVEVAMTEGGVSEWARKGDRNTNGVYSSFGPFQLHYGGLGEPNSAYGLGDSFTAATGLDARDPANGPAAVDFALRMAKAGGWKAWHGWHGDPMAGIDRYDMGGVVPGPWGAPRMAVVHGGETVIPVGGGGPVVVVQFNGPVFGDRDALKRQVTALVNQGFRTGDIKAARR